MTGIFPIGADVSSLDVRTTLSEPLIRLLAMLNSCVDFTGIQLLLPVEVQVSHDRVLYVRLLGHSSTYCLLMVSHGVENTHGVATGRSATAVKVPTKFTTSDMIIHAFTPTHTHTHIHTPTHKRDPRESSDPDRQSRSHWSLAPGTTDQSRGEGRADQAHSLERNLP